ncbi:aminodeoxychorismate synthase component I [soil metagenome]
MLEITCSGPPAAPRFDALLPGSGGRSIRFYDARGVLRADTLAEVLPVLRAVEDALARGLHAAGFVSYEAAPALDPVLPVRDAEPGFPLARFGIFAAREEVRSAPAAAGAWELGPWRASVEAAEYTEHVREIRERIAAGETYQVNHTLRLRADFRGDERAFYGHLCQTQAAEYCAYLPGDRYSVLSASPELFFRWADDELELRPMKGTRPRGRWPAEDHALAAELLASPKERAENLMIVDLLRNDAGRISEFGSVHVPRLFEVESYPTIHQLTSTIRARVRAGTTLTEVFRALFPCGSVTGAPKISTMGVIAELENAPRGIYTGAIGFASPGESVFSVAIRTLVLDRASGVVQMGVGSGITWDSQAPDEYEECFAKAAFVRADPVQFELLETLLLEGTGQVFLLDEHLARLAASADRWGFRCDVGAIRQRLLQDARTEHGTGAGACKLRLRLARDGAVRVESQRLPPESAAPVKVAICAEPVDSRDPMLYHKTTRREPYDRRRAAHPDRDDVLVVNERGELTESTLANLVVARNGELWTPPVDAGLLPGVFREVLLREGEIRERTLRPEDLWEADGVYLINSVRKWRTATVTP